LHACELTRQTQRVAQVPTGRDIVRNLHHFLLHRKNYKVCYSRSFFSALWLKYSKLYFPSLCRDYSSPGSAPTQNCSEREGARNPPTASDTASAVLNHSAKISAIASPRPGVSLHWKSEAQLRQKPRWLLSLCKPVSSNTSKRNERWVKVNTA
jgi:hypothetical protein